MAPPGFEPATMPLCHLAQLQRCCVKDYCVWDALYIYIIICVDVHANMVQYFKMICKHLLVLPSLHQFTTSYLLGVSLLLVTCQNGRRVLSNAASAT